MLADHNKLRHLAFFEAIASLDDEDPRAKAVAAGLVVLRLVDSWIEEGADAVAPNRFGVRSVRAAIDEVDAGNPVHAVLARIVDAMQVSRGLEVQDVMPRVMAYGRALEYEGNWELANDVYESVIAHTHPTQESETAILAHLQRGVCLRTLSRFDEALESYEAAGSIAAQVGDMMGVLRAKIGDAIVTMARGNLPRADEAFERVAREAAAAGKAGPHSMALHGRAAIAGFRGNHELTIRFAYDALNISPAPSERDRILSDIGTAFHKLGIRSAARDAFMVLSVTAQEQYMRWAAMLELMTLAAEEGSQLAFYQHQQALNAAPLPPQLQTEYQMDLGKSYRLLGDPARSTAAFREAIRLAEAYGYGRLLFEAERALQEPARPAVASAEEVISPAISDVATAMRTMREEVMA